MGHAIYIQYEAGLIPSGFQNKCRECQNILMVLYDVIYLTRVESKPLQQHKTQKEF